MMAEMLLKQGHRNMVYFMRSEDRPFPRYGQRGFFETMVKNGVADIEDRCFCCFSKTRSSTIALLKKMKQCYPGFTAIACNNDMEAFQVLQVAPAAGIDIPGKVLLTGFGNVREVQSLFQFPTIDQHPHDMGLHACGKLIELIEHGPGHVQFVDMLDVSSKW